MNFMWWYLEEAWESPAGYSRLVAAVGGKSHPVAHSRLVEAAAADNIRHPHHDRRLYQSNLLCHGRLYSHLCTFVLIQLQTMEISDVYAYLHLHLCQRNLLYRHHYLHGPHAHHDRHDRRVRLALCDVDDNFKWVSVTTECRQK